MKNPLKIIASVSLIVVLICSGLAINYLSGLNSVTTARENFNSLPGNKMPVEPDYTVDEKYESPVYYTIFKFISSYLPFKNSAS